MTHDAELLRTFSRDGDEAAFAELVQRHLGVVYGVALRCCSGNTAQAEDVTQQVFTELARQSTKLARHPALLGWLHTTTRFTAMKLLRSERRRRQREEQASLLQQIDAADAVVDWEQLKPLLDAALGDLRDRDRAALLLRFVEGKTLHEVGESLRISETAARSCVDRAMEKLRSRLARQGLTSTSAALSIALAHPGVAAVPPGLAATITSAAVASASTGGVTLLPFFAMNKLIITAAAIVAVVEVASLTSALSEKWDLDDEFRMLNQVRTAPTVASASHIEDTTMPQASSETSAHREERDALQMRLSQLKARPAGVTDAHMLPPANVGRATPQDAVRTLAWALQNRDLETLAQFVVYDDDSAENRAAFMSHFSPAVQERYKTPERLAVAFSFANELRDPPVAQQVVNSHQYYMGALIVSLWARHESGIEKKTDLPLQESNTGWALTPLTLAGKNNRVNRILQRLDPVSGDFLPLPTQASAPRQ